MTRPELSMETADLASALIGAQLGRVQLAAAAKMVKMNAEADASIVQVVEAAQQNLNRLANVAAGVGGQVDFSV